MVDLSLVKPKNLWYVIGFITADGNLSKNGRHINITSKDESVIKLIKKALILKNKIGKKSRGKEKEKKYFYFQFGDVKFYNFLLNIGLMPNKSLKLGELFIPKKYFNDFLRGLIDGDGCIRNWIHSTNNNEQWAVSIFSGSKKFTLWLLSSIENHFLIKGRVHNQKGKGKKNSIYILKFGKFASKIMLKKCYYRNCIALDRKYKKAIQCLKAKDRLSKYGNTVMKPGCRNW